MVEIEVPLTDAIKAAMEELRVLVERAEVAANRIRAFEQKCTDSPVIVLDLRRYSNEQIAAMINAAHPSLEQINEQSITDGGKL